ncbi:LysR family transcriptional regulator [Streptomyces sp. NPDC016562]|uniref:helix-turn-helix domain-containing protein n=1 Tax=Streptomyces sp. NPDC016562 TaxID=3364966 RepID=UPI0036FAF6F3
MDVGLRDLELLHTTAAAGSLRAAAERLYVSQSALSQRLTRLEARLGMQLFDRRGRRLTQCSGPPVAGPHPPDLQRIGVGLPRPAGDA